MGGIVIPYRRRPQQKLISEALATYRWVVAVCHRRMGKTVAAVNELQKAALTCPRERPRYAYIAPTYKQGKATTWDYMVHYAGGIPGVTINHSELRVDYALNNSQVRIYGADSGSVENLRGLYLDGVVLDEYGLHPRRAFSEIIRPALADRTGWALFLGTPNGMNQFAEVAETAKTDPSWKFLEFKASQTGLISGDELRAARAMMTEDEYNQEFECSFTAAVKGAIYARELDAARAEGRITTVPYDPALPVDTDWDLGIGDAMAVWFSQSTRSGEVRLIDFYEASGEGFPHYVQVLRDKGYTYGAHWAPHDIGVRELGTGKSRLEMAATFGLKFSVTPRVIRELAGMEVEEGINIARVLFPRCWFDQTKCKPGLDALQNYRRDYNTRLDEFKATPVHDWACFAPDTMVLTPFGMRQIMHLPRSGEVWTPCGWSTYQGPEVTRRHAQLVEVRFSDGSTVRCTPDHKFWTASGWRCAESLPPGSLIPSCSTPSCSTLMAGSIASGRKSGTLVAAVIDSIVLCGRRHLARYRMGATFIIAMVTRAITTWRTWNVFLRVATCPTHGISTSVEWPSRLQRAGLQPHGIGRRRDGRGIGVMRNEARVGQSGVVSESPVSYAGASSPCSFVQETLRSIAQKPAKLLRIESVRPVSERQDVWCINIPALGCFALANGVIVHNSHAADAFRGLAVRHQTPVTRTGPTSQRYYDPATQQQSWMA